jgi:hypothetical protein
MGLACVNLTELFEPQGVISITGLKLQAALVGRFPPFTSPVRTAYLLTYFKRRHLPRSLPKNPIGSGSGCHGILGTSLSLAIVPKTIGHVVTKPKAQVLPTSSGFDVQWNENVR